MNAQSRARARVLGLALCGLVWLGGAPSALAGDFEQAVLDEINFARTQPGRYARELEAGAGSDSWEGPGDVEALAEAIDFLKRQQPLSPLSHDPRLADAAFVHARAQGASGGLGHGGSQPLAQRLQSRGVWAGLMAENISYGHDRAREVVEQLIVDRGVPGRGHRRNIFGPSFRSAGVGCGPHRTYGAMCVIEFVGAMVAR